MAAFDFGVASERARRTLDGFTRGQKTMLVLAGVAVAVGALVLSRWSGSGSYSTLYANLAPADAAAVTSRLDSQGISYRLGAGGTSIQVPQDAVYRTRIDMSAEGIPADSSPGYALLDKQGLTTSDFRQKVDYQRALEGELSKTIRAIDGVAAVSVHLVIPKEDLFSGDSSKPSASVLVRTMGDTKLRAGQVQAIVHLVASSVEGLVPEDVTVADSNGNVLAAPGQDGAAASNTRVEQTKAYEDALALSLQQMVQKITGDGHAVVKVKAELDFDKKSTTRESFADPNTRTALAEKTSKETFTGGNSGAAATGVLGANGTSGTTPPNVPGNASSYLKEDTQSDYAIGKVIEQTDALPGTVNRMSIAVLLDSTRKIKAADAASLRKLVFAAAGLQTSRGDTLELGQLTFDDTSKKAMATELAMVSASEGKKAMVDLIKSVLLGLLALLSVLMAYRAAKKANSRIISSIPLDSLPRSSSLALPTLAELEQDASELGLPPAPANNAPLPLPASPRPDIAALIDQQPDEVANTLREWLADRRS